MKRYEFKIHYNTNHPGPDGRKGTLTHVVHAKTFKMATWLLEGILPQRLWKFTPVYTGHTVTDAAGTVVKRVERQWKWLLPNNKFLGLV